MVFRICGVISSISVAVLKQSYIFTFSIFNPAVCRLYNLILCFICLVHICPISSNTYILCSFCPLLRGTFLHFHQLEQFCSSNSAGANSSCHQNLSSFLFAQAGFLICICLKRLFPLSVFSWHVYLHQFALAAPWQSPGFPPQPDGNICHPNPHREIGANSFRFGIESNIHFKIESYKCDICE